MRQLAIDYPGEKTSQDLKLSSRRWNSVCPGGVLVEVILVAKTAVQDADEAVAQCAQRLLVSVVSCAVLVTEGASATPGDNSAHRPAAR